MTDTPFTANGEPLTITLPDERQLTLTSPTCIAELPPLLALVWPVRHWLAVLTVS